MTGCSATTRDIKSCGYMQRGRKVGRSAGCNGSGGSWRAGYRNEICRSLSLYDGIFKLGIYMKGFMTMMVMHDKSRVIILASIFRSFTEHLPTFYRRRAPSFCQTRWDGRSCRTCWRFNCGENVVSLHLFLFSACQSSLDQRGLSSGLRIVHLLSHQQGPLDI